MSARLPGSPALGGLMTERVEQTVLKSILLCVRVRKMELEFELRAVQL